VLKWVTDRLFQTREAALGRLRDKQRNVLVHGNNNNNNNTIVIIIIIIIITHKAIFIVLSSTAHFGKINTCESTTRLRYTFCVHDGMSFTLNLIKTVNILSYRLKIFSTTPSYQLPVRVPLVMFWYTEPISCMLAFSRIRSWLLCELVTGKQKERKMQKWHEQAAYQFRGQRSRNSLSFDSTNTSNV